MKQPNIILIFSDQQRYDTLGCNGQPLDITPHLDKMAAEGVNYKRAYTIQPVCGPARAVLQSGVYPTVTGCYRNAKALPLGYNSLARRLKAAGYDMGYVGKWHLASDLDGYSKENKEAGHYYETLPVPLERRGGYDGFWAASDTLEHTSHGYGGHVYDEQGNKREFTGYRADSLTDYALEFLDTQTGEKPFFLFLGHVEPHHQNDRNCYEGPDGSREKYAGFTPPPELEPGQGDWEAEYPDYLGCCNAVDYNVGRVIDTLMEKGMYDNTIIIYTTDHGSHFQTMTSDVMPGGMDDYKRNCHENTIHIPMIIRGPGFMGGIDETRLVSLLDIPKTIIEAAGGDSNGMQGDSLLDMGDSWKKEVYVQISESYVGRAIRTDRYTYCVHAPDKHPWNDSGSGVYQDKYLFDNETDPHQKTNLIDRLDYDIIKKELRTRLIAWAEKAGEGEISIRP